MTKTKYLLLGLHNPSIMYAYSMLAKHHRYEVDNFDELNDLLSACQDEKYSRIIMDINLESPGSHDITPILNINRVLKEKISEGKIKLIGISGDPSIVKKAKDAGINSILNADLSGDDLIKFLE